MMCYKVGYLEMVNAGFSLLFAETRKQMKICIIDILHVRITKRCLSKAASFETIKTDFKLT